MEWKLFAHLRDVAGESVTVDVERDATFETALDALLSAHPGLAEEVLDEDDDLATHVHLLVDGEDPFAGGAGLATPVDPETELALFPPVSGG